MDEHRGNHEDRVQEPPNHGEQNSEETDSLRNEEYAAEFTADDYNERRDTEGMNEEPTTVYGWIGVALSAISFFIMPIILGAAGIILGFVSRSRGADTLGNIAIAAGAVSILITMFILPFV